MAIAFDNQSSSSLTFSDASIKDIHLNNASTSKVSNQETFDSPELDSKNLHSAEAEIFQQLLSHSGDASSVPLNSVKDSPGDASPLTLSLTFADVNKAVLNQVTTANIALNTIASSSSPAITPTGGANTSVTGISGIPASYTTAGQIALQISGTLNSLSAMSNGTIHSFSVLIPGQANLNISTQVLASGVRSIQLDSDEKKFHSWLQENSSELSLALSKEFKTPIQLSVGAVA